MLQRVQTIYLLLFIGISAALLSGIAIIGFNASGEYINDDFSLELNTLKIEALGQLKVPQEAIDEFEKNIKKTPFSFNRTNQMLSLSLFSPLLIVQIILLALSVFTLIGYKNIKRQLRLARLTFLLTLIYVVFIMLFAYFGLQIARPYIEELPFDSVQVSRLTYFGFYLVCTLLPFSYLAVLGVKRDYTLVRSVERLR